MLPLKYVVVFVKTPSDDSDFPASSIIISCYGLIRLWRRSGLVVIALVSGSSGPGSSGLGHCVVFLGKTLNFYTASLHPGL